MPTINASVPTINMKCKAALTSIILVSIFWKDSAAKDALVGSQHRRICFEMFPGEWIIAEDIYVNENRSSCPQTATAILLLMQFDNINQSFTDT